VKSVEDPPVRDIPIELPTERHEESLAREWLEAWSAKREAEAKMAELRVEIERLLDNGAKVGNRVGYVTWATTKVLRAEPAGLFQAIGPQMYVRVSEVPTTKLRELLQAGLVSLEAEFLYTETHRRLLTKLR
jgi:hypothetical protein